ncbi:AMP-binding protein [Streptosporangium saharense]|uniref:AMP-binding protein n=1 Tax=Streptosporangium saharense TaxID=1706840 RepID=UPI00332FD983
MKYLHGWFLRGLAVNPEGVALRVGRHALTYRELHERARRWAGAVPAGATRVGVLGTRSLDGFAALLGALYTGAAVVPLNAAYPAERTRTMIEAADLSALIVTVPSDSLDGVTEPGAPTDPVEAGPEDVAYILFTSGSTGRPKGVPVSHRNVTHYLDVVGERYRPGPDDVFSQTFDHTFDLAMFDMFCAWGAGAELVQVPPSAYGRLPRFLTTHGVTVWFSSPSAIALAERLRQLKPGALPTLRWSLFCGEPLLAHDAAAWQAAAPSSVVENLYGPTELTISCSVHRWDPERSPAACVNDVVPIGELHRGLDHVIIDGELCVTGEQMIAGYLDPADDEGRFLVRDGVRYYRTGDLVQESGDGLVHLGRRDHQVQIGGRRVELAEIDAGLRRCDAVRDSVTVFVDGDLHTFYLGDDVPAAELRGLLAAVFPQYMIPKHLVRLAEYPLNANRKIDRNALTVLARGSR